MSDGRTRLLVVTADPQQANRFASWAPREWVVGTARDGRSALRAVDEGVDLVLLSYSLPDRSGDGVVRELRNRGYECQVVPVVEDGSDPEVSGDPLVTPVDRSTFRTRMERAGERVAYDQRVREYYSLAAEIADLEARMSPAELAESEEYARLSERADRLRSQVDDLLADASEGGYEPVFQGFFPGKASTA